MGLSAADEDERRQVGELFPHVPADLLLGAGEDQPGQGFRLRGEALRLRWRWRRPGGLGLSVRTVEWQVARLPKKLGLPSRAALVAYAARQSSAEQDERCHGRFHQA